MQTSCERGAQVFSAACQTVSCIIRLTPWDTLAVMSLRWHRHACATANCWGPACPPRRQTFYGSGMERVQGHF